MYSNARTAPFALVRKATFAVLMVLSLTWVVACSSTNPVDPTPPAPSPVILEPELVTVGEAIRSISGNESDSGFAVGSRGLILEWNGTSWEPIEMPPGTALDVRFQMVWVDPDGVACFIGRRTLGIYDHGDWTVQESLPFTNPVSMWARSKDDIYVLDTLLYHFDGGRWEAEVLPDRIRQLNSVFGSGDTVVAVGAGGQVVQKVGNGAWENLEVDFSQDLLELYKPTANDNYVVGLDGDFLYFSSVGAGSEKNIPLSPGGPPRHVHGLGGKTMYLLGSIVRSFGGNDFTRLGNNPRSLNAQAIWESPGKRLFLGSQLGRGIQEFDGTAWQVDARNSGSAGVGSIWADGQGGAIVGTTQGILHIRDGQIVRSINFDQAVRAIWGSRPDDVWAATAVGTLLHFDGVLWSEFITLGLGKVRALWGRSSNEVYAVGSGNAAFRFDGATWIEMEQTVTDDLFYLAGAGDLVVASNGPVMLRLVDQKWEADVSPSSEIEQILTVGGLVVARDRVNLYIARADGWDTVALPDILADADAIAGNALDDLFVLQSGVVSHFDGESLQEQTTLSVWRPEGLAMVGPREPWLLGWNIIRWVEP